MDRDNLKPRAAVRNDASTGRSRVVKDVNLSAVLYVLGTGEWLVLRLLSYVSGDSTGVTLVTNHYISIK